MPFSIVSLAEDSSQRPFKTLNHAYSSPTDSMIVGYTVFIALLTAPDHKCKPRGR